MKTLLLSLSFVLFSVLAFGQSKRENQLYSLFNKSGFKKYWGDGEFDNKSAKAVAKFYSCLERNYKINPLDYPEFTPIKEFEKKNSNTNDIQKNDILKQSSLYYKAYGRLDYHGRLSIQETYPKCIKKSDIDW